MCHLVPHAFFFFVAVVLLLLLRVSFWCGALELVGLTVGDYRCTPGTRKSPRGPEVLAMRSKVVSPSLCLRVPVGSCDRTYAIVLHELMTIE